MNDVDKKEVWKDVVGYEDIYEVSNFGEVRSYRFGKIKQDKTRKGFYRSRLLKNKKIKVEKTHEIVAKAFIPNPNGFKYVFHKDGDISNNNVENLQWGKYPFAYMYDVIGNWKTMVYQGIEYPRVEVSDKGELRNVETGTIYKQTLNQYGYPGSYISLGDGVFKRINTHKAVAETFIPNPENKPMVNHIDGIKTNNNVNNLEWSTSYENMQHAWDTGLMGDRSGVNNPHAKLTPEQVQYIRDTYVPKDKEFGSYALGDKFNISPSCIPLVANGISYYNV